MKPLQQGPATSLRVWIPLVFALFVILGSVGLLLVFENQAQVEERDAFGELARVNAAYMERTRLPRTRRMAERLSEVIGAQVAFRDPVSGRVEESQGSDIAKLISDMGAKDRVDLLPDGRLVAVATDESGVQMILLKNPQFRGLADLGSAAWLAIGLFWVLSLGLGLALSRWVSAPLQSLVKALPKVGTDEQLPALPIKRRDEIGSLARVLDDTHRSLREERELRRQAERLALLGRMATGIAHEIRNPAAAIRLHTELLDVTDAKALSNSKQLILDEAKRLENLVSQWMHFSRPEPPKTSEMDLVGLLREVIEVMTPQARHMNAEIKMEVAPTASVLVQADRFRLHQVFSNLVLNAVQAMPKGGRVTLKLEENDQRVIVEVNDEGLGFSESALERGIEPFFSEKEGGLGLGLAVAMDICKAHGGSMKLMNRDGAGASIRVELKKISPHNGQSA